MQDQQIIQLVQGCKKQDQGAQIALYDLFFSAMYNTSLRIVQDKMLAEDIVQDTFIIVFSKINGLTEEVTFPKWLKQIVVNKSLDYLKQERRFTSLEFYDLEAKIEDDLIIENHTEEVQRVVTEIDSLKDNYRVLLTLYYIEGYDYEEIVEITGFTHVNCRTLLSRARQSLRKKLY